MAEELLGPELAATIVAPPGVQTTILNVLSAGEDARLKPELEQSLWNVLTWTIQKMVTESGYEHDGFHFSWNLVSVYADENEVVVPAHINVNVKSDDFEFFEGLLKDEENLSSLLIALKSSIGEFLLASGISKSSFSISAESTGFGYG